MVTLNSLELFNFKSFAKKTKIQFDKNITLIVGPNGSGKSNIIDALVWVLGERETKSLRLQKSDELIFSGKDKENRPGLAWVSLDFSDEEGKKIQIKRKIVREGISTFYLGSKQASLKEILEFLAKKRISAKGTNIIRQGETSKILQIDDQKRKMMVEDILGVKVYQLKKHQAELKLKSSQDNLSQAQKLLEEILPLRRSLKWQISRYQKREEIEKQLKEKEKEYFSLKYLLLKKSQRSDYQKEKEKIEKEIKLLEEKIALKEKEREKDQKEEKCLQEKIFALRQKKELLNDKENNLLREIGKIEGIIESQEKEKNQKNFKIEKEKIENFFSFLEEKLFSLKKINQLEILYLEIEKILKKIEEIKLAFLGRSRGGDFSEKNLKERKENLQREIDSLEKETEKIDKEIQSLEEEIQKKREENQSIWQKIDQLKEEIFLKKKRIDELNYLENSFQYQKESFLEELKESGWLFSEFENYFEEWQKNLEGNPNLNKEKLNNLKREILKKRGQLASIGKIDQSIIEEERKIEERYQFLKKQIEDLEETKKHLEKLIKNLAKEIDTLFSEGIKKINLELARILKETLPHSWVKLELAKIKKNPESETEKESLQDKEETIEGLKIKLNWKGKNIKSPDILSGGEKTLLAIVILMAIAKSFSPPFIVLDEVDAALDEENSKKVAEIFSNLAENSQLIIVSHNQTTIKIANVLYGVTMDSSHSSKVISYKLK